MHELIVISTVLATLLIPWTKLWMTSFIRNTMAVYSVFGEEHG